MILSVLLKHFGIDIDMPEYLLYHPFNEVFLDGDVTVEDNVYTIAVRTRQDVTHQMFLKANDEFPVIVMSELPNGKLNGMKFPRTEHVGIPINKL